MIMDDCAYKRSQIVPAKFAVQSVANKLSPLSHHA